MANTCIEKKKQRKITYCMGGNETENDFVLVGKNNRKYLKAIPWGIATLAGGSRHRQKKVEESREEQTNVWKKGVEIEGKQHENKISRKS